MSTHTADQLRLPRAPRTLTLTIDGELWQFIRSKRIGDETDLAVLRRLLGAPNQSRTTQLQEFMLGPDFVALRTASARFLAILNELHKLDGNRFISCALDFRRGHRVYFSRSRKQIEASAVSAQARRIHGTRLWVLTNITREQKRGVVLRLLQGLGYSPLTVTWVRQRFLAGLPERKARRALKRR